MGQLKSKMIIGWPFIYLMWIEYFIIRKLIEGSESGITELLQLTGLNEKRAQITRENTGLILLVEVNK